MTLMTRCFSALNENSFHSQIIVSCIHELSLLPVDDCTHVEADILKSPHSAFFHCMHISWLVIHQDRLHAALEGPLGGWEQCLEKIPWNQPRINKDTDKKLEREIWEKKTSEKKRIKMYGTGTRVIIN